MDLAILLRSGDVAAVAHAMDIAVTALMSGERAIIALFDDALRFWATALAGTPVADPEDGVAVARLQGGWRLSEVVEICRELSPSGLDVLACSGAVERLNYDADALVTMQIVDDVVGLPTIWRRASDRRLIAV